MKKIILSIFALVWLFWFWFTADYAAWCINGQVWAGNYDCQSCAWSLYDTWQIIGSIQFYKKCCASWGSLYDNDSKCCASWGEVYDSQKKCCEWWSTSLSQDKTKCCGVWEEAYKNKNNNNKCCDWVVTGYVAGGYDMCCWDWETINEEWECVESCQTNKWYGRGTSLGGWNNKCCLWERYDFDSVTENYAQCCDGITYDETLWYIWGDNDSNSEADDSYQCCAKWSTLQMSNWKLSCVSCSILTSWQVDALTPAALKNNCNIGADWCQWEIYTWSNWVRLCCPGMMVDDDEWNPVCIENNEWNMWINMSSECLINGQCSYNIYQTLWIRKSDQNPSVSTFVKDIVLAVTMFIGTVVSIVLIISGILYIVSSIQWNSTSADMAKKWIINSIVWLLLVVSSYAIVRLIQFLATAGWW